MAKKLHTRTLQVLGKEIVAEEAYYLNNPNMPASGSRFEYTPEMLEAAEKCSKDIIYFAENFFVVVASGVRQIIKLYDFQKEILRDMVDNNRVIMLTSRQIGKTTLFTIFALWTAMFKADQHVVLLANKDSRAKGNLKRIKLAYESMENWFKETVVSNNDHLIEFSNGSKIEAQATTENSARGDSVTVVCVDELAFVAPEKAQAFWSGFTPSLSSNKNAKFFVASTPRVSGDLFYTLCDDAIKGKNDFILKKYKWDAVPGRDEKWKEDAIRNLCHNDEAQFRRDFECDFVGSTLSPFPAHYFTRLKAEARKPIRTEMDGSLSIWKEPEENRIYTIGVDVAEGVGKDYSCVQVFDITDLNFMEQCACYYCNTIDTISFTEIVYNISKKYGFPWLSVERNNCGVDVCQRLYYDKTYPRFVTVSTGNDSKNFRPGVLNTQNTKSPAVTNFKYWACDSGIRLKIYDERFHDELSHFQKNKNGSWGAEEPFHDDMVMAAVWAMFVLHRSQVNKLFLVESVTEEGVPKKIHPTFTYEIQKEERDLLSSEFVSPLNNVLGVIAFDNGRRQTPAEAGWVSYANYIEENDPFKDDPVWRLFQNGNWEEV